MLGTVEKRVEWSINMILVILDYVEYDINIIRWYRVSNN